jgi:type II secretory pathway pseudopilin PulG
MQAVVKADLDDPNFPAEIEAAMRCDPFTLVCLPPPDPSDNRQKLESQFNDTQTTNEQAAQQLAAQQAAQQAQQQQAQSSADSGSDPLLMLGILQGALQNSAPQTPATPRNSSPVYTGGTTTNHTSNPPPSTAPVCTTQSCLCPGPGSTSVK